MKTLIIYAHPATPGHCPKILETVEKRLKAKAIDYEVIDLYKTKYDPVLYENEHFTAGFYGVSSVNKGMQEKILAADKLIFIYPIWWNSMPAIMKGFLDKVFVSKFGFQYVPFPMKFFIPSVPMGLLKGKKAAVFITSGAPYLLSMLVQGGRAGKIISRDILGFCGIRSRVFQLGNCSKYSDERVPKIEALVERGLRYLY